MPYATQIPWLLQKALTTLKTTTTDNGSTDGIGAIVRQSSVLDIKLMMEQRLQHDLRGVTSEMKAYFAEVWVHDYFWRGLNDFPGRYWLPVSDYDHLLPTRADTIKPEYIPGYVSLVFDPQERRREHDIQEWDCSHYSVAPDSSTLFYQKYDSEGHPGKKLGSRFSGDVFGLLSQDDSSITAQGNTPRTATTEPSSSSTVKPERAQRRRLRTRRYGPPVPKRPSSRSKCPNVECPEPNIADDVCRGCDSTIGPTGENKVSLDSPTPKPPAPKTKCPCSKRECREPNVIDGICNGCGTIDSTYVNNMATTREECRQTSLGQDDKWRW